MSKATPGKRARAPRHPYLNTVMLLVAALLLVAVILVNLLTHVLPVVRYNGSGMEPNLHTGQLLVLLKTQKVEQGDVIAFYYNNKILVRRVISTGAQQLSIAEDGTVSLNGTVLEEPYVDDLSMGQCNLTFPYYVPPDHVFVMGDKRDTAMDSRLEEIGPISTDRILGKILLTI